MSEEMTLQKAIEIISDAAYNGCVSFDPDFTTALRIAHRCMVQDLINNPDVKP